MGDINRQGNTCLDEKYWITVAVGEESLVCSPLFRENIFGVDVNTDLIDSARQTCQASVLSPESMGDFLTRTRPLISFLPIPCFTPLWISATATITELCKY